ncbi:putative glycolipid-binding domain-containing protein [Cryobacterium arcticum]|uniref:Glycolipid-binding domain-containing protein n=1 Tax=Cryobacterium arcticum TaxID=670052 RepID=A0A1B1BF53_9MICO|nr:putative glycolipid-binding domain-containing protein [Cryobacterium arcticum]ANP71192.1 hypothetical protein PA27867_0218 [Cryobacterium arcticum]
MHLKTLPRQASWRHSGVRQGFEVLFTDSGPRGHRLRGVSTAVEDASAWSVDYSIDLDPVWRTQEVRAAASTVDGERHTVLRRSADRGWEVDGIPRADLTGCVDVDFESSCVTNTLPLHRLEFVAGEPVRVPAAFVRANDLSIVRLEQEYTLTALSPRGLSFHYESRSFDVTCELTFDTAGLILAYPGIAVRDA